MLHTRTIKSAPGGCLGALAGLRPPSIWGWRSSGCNDGVEVLQKPTRDPRDPGVLVLLAHDLRTERHARDRHERHGDGRCEQHRTWKVEDGIAGWSRCQRLARRVAGP